MFNKELFASLPKSSYCGRELLYYETLTSTSDIAKQLAAEGAEAGLTVIAGSQSAGRGTKGRFFASPEGAGLYMSVILRPELKLEEAVYFTFAAALCVRESLKELYSIEARIKYVNDILIEGKKVCGILTEAAGSGEKADYICIGIGLNIKRGALPPSLSETAASLEDFTYFSVCREKLAASILTKLEYYAENFNINKIKTEYAKYLVDPTQVL